MKPTHTLNELAKMSNVPQDLSRPIKELASKYGHIPVMVRHVIIGDKLVFEVIL